MIRSAFIQSVKSEPLAWSTVFWSSVLAASMSFSPFLLSIGMWGLVGTAFWQAAANVRMEPWFSNSNWFQKSWRLIAWSIQQWWRQPVLRWLGLLFWLTALSGIWSDDLGYWWERTRVRAPLFVLPWAFANLPKINASQLRIPLYTLIATIAIICIGVGIRLALHYDEIMYNLSLGQPIPVPRHHIRFNLMLVTATISSAWLGMNAKSKRQKILWGLGSFFLFLFIHVLSVRSGIAALYAALLYVLVRYGLNGRQWLRSFAALTLLALMLLIAVEKIPSLAQRLAYMKYDWSMYQQNSGADYSDSERLISLKVGYEIWKQHPLLGVGAGDIESETFRTTKALFPRYEQTPKLPHNQFLYILAATGLLGFLLSIVAFAAPYLFQHRSKHPLFSPFQAIVFVSFLVEYTIETSIGVAFYIFYTLWFLKMSENAEPQSET